MIVGLGQHQQASFYAEFENDLLVEAGPDLPVSFGQAAGPALAAALPPDEHGWRVLTLSFEHERAAVHRLAGFADQVEVLAPPSVRAGLVATARQILGRYDAAEP